MDRYTEAVLERIDEPSLVELTRQLISFETINPPGNERGCAQFIAEQLNSWAFPAELKALDPNRPNVQAILRGEGGEPKLLFNGHMDVIAPGEGWEMDPFAGHVSEGRIYGRGSSDMKSGLAAMMMACKAISQSNVRLRGDLIFTAVVDEESFGPIGTKFLLDQGLRTDAAIVGEPTDLSIDVANRGILWVEFKTHGKAAHGSRPWLGRNAIYSMVELIRALKDLEPQLASKTHPLLSSPTLNVSTIAGGMRVNYTPDSCTITVDRRIIPGESFDEALEEFKCVVDQLRSNDPQFNASIRVINKLPPMECPKEHGIVSAIAEALHQGTGNTATVGGKDGTTDASWLSMAGIPTVIFGPGNVESVFTNFEHTEIGKLVIAAKVYCLSALRLLK